MPKYIGAVDQGTTSTRFILFRTEDGKDVARADRKHKQIKPHEGWLEHNPEEIMKSVTECIDECLENASIDGDDVLAIGLTNQRETVVVWDRNTGEALYNAIVWSDNRTGKTAEKLRGVLGEDFVKELTGLRISSYFSAVKLQWLMDNVEGLKNKILDGSAMFGTIDTWIVWNFTGNYVTDVTNAGRTMMMNLEKCQWESTILDTLGVPKERLPDIRSSSEVYGYVKEGVTKRLVGTPVAGILGDQQAALVGQAGFDVGNCKNTYGTGSFFILNTGLERRVSRNLLTTPAYKFGPESPCVYALEGSVECAGRVAEWLCENLGFASDVSKIEALARKASAENQVYFVPAFNELYAPFWDGSARGCILGMTLNTTKADIAHAALQSIALRVCDVLKEAAKDLGDDANFSLHVDGGATKNELLLQMQADLANCKVVRPKQKETTALGAAYAAGFAMKDKVKKEDVGVFAHEKAFRESWQSEVEFKPEMRDRVREEILKRWEQAVERAKHWAT